MRKAIVALSTTILALGGASAAQAAMTQQAAVNMVLGQASHIPAAQTPAQAVQYRTELQPAVNAAVAAGATQALASSKDLNVLAALLVASPPTGKGVSSPSTGIPEPSNAPYMRRTAHAAGCWGTAYYQWLFYEAGATVAWIYTSINGWCGNGSSITWYGGASFSKWEWGPYCVGAESTNFSWDVPYSWLHAGHWGSLGLNYQFGCFTFAGGHATVRVAANGYADAYDDFGY